MDYIIFVFGITSNLHQRMFQHDTAFFPDCYTANKRPLELVFYAEFTDISLAFEKEKQIKKWSRVKKEALINGDYDALSKKFSLNKKTTNRNAVRGF